jgi:hypothetical protein
MIYRNAPLATRLYPLFCALRMAWGSPLARMDDPMSTFGKHDKPEEPKDSPAYMFKLVGSIGLILLGGLFAGMSRIDVACFIADSHSSPG